MVWLEAKDLCESRQFVPNRDHSLDGLWAFGIRYVLGQVIAETLVGLGSEHPHVQHIGEAFAGDRWGNRVRGAESIA